MISEDLLNGPSSDAAIWLARENGISENDARLLVEVARICRGRPTRWVGVKELDPSFLDSALWLVHRGLLLTMDQDGALYVFPGDKGRDAIRAANRVVRRARRAA